MTDSNPQVADSPVSFDLLTEPWIPCRTIAGETVELGLRELFATAHELDSIADPSPLTEFSLYRLMLAVAHSVYRGPATTAEWRAIWEPGHFEGARFDAYFDRWQERFDLFHPEWPFYQVGHGFVTVSGKGDKAKPAPSPASRLVPELAAGNNATLFDHSTDDRVAGLAPAQVARAVVAAQTLGLGGGKGPTSNLFGVHPYMSHAPCVGPMAALIRGDTLFASLVLNLARISSTSEAPFVTNEKDVPAWERDTRPEPGERTPVGYLDFLTFQARYLRVAPPGLGAPVTEAFIASGASLASDTPFRSPFAFSRLTDKGVKTIRCNPGRALWRDSEALLGFHEGGHDGRPDALRFASNRRLAKLMHAAGVSQPWLRVEVYGLANDKAKLLAWTKSSVTAPLRVVDESEAVGRIARALELANAYHACVRKAVRYQVTATLETESKSADPHAVTAATGRVLQRSGYWASLEPAFTAFAHELDEPALQRFEASAAAAAAASFRAASELSWGAPARADRAAALAERHFRGLLSKARPEFASSPAEAASVSAQA